MKKLLVILFLGSLTGCKKDYDCNCKVQEGRRGFVAISEFNYHYNRTTKEKALEKCEQDLLNDGQSLTNYTCAIK